MTDDENETADALVLIARALQRLGTADASTHFGALELVAMELRNGSQDIAGAIRDLADAIRERP